jgi:hypothetical protein
MLHSWLRWSRRRGVGAIATTAADRSAFRTGRADLWGWR